MDQRKKLEAGETCGFSLITCYTRYTSTYTRRHTHSCTHTRSQSEPLLMLRPFPQVFLGISKGCLTCAQGSELQVTLILNSAIPINATVAPPGFACYAWASVPI